MKGKYTCPKCNSSLILWEEMQYDRYSNINPNTGRINKTGRDLPPHPLGNSGIKCSNDECDLMYNTIEMVWIGCNVTEQQLKTMEDICEDIFNR